MAVPGMGLWQGYKEAPVPGDHLVGGPQPKLLSEESTIYSDTQGNDSSDSLDLGVMIDPI